MSGVNDLYRRVVEAQRELISLATPDGTLLYVNPAYARHFDSSAVQLVGGNLYDFIDPQDREPVRERIAEVIASGQTAVSENRRPRRAGEPERWVEWTNIRQHDADGRVLLHSVGRDVTDAINAKRALLDSQAFLAATGRVAGVGGWQLRLADNSLVWSAHTRRLHEVADDFVPDVATAIDFYEPESRPLIRAAVERAIADGTPWDLELALRTAKGRVIWVRAVGEAVFAGGQVVSVAGAIQDITERKQLEQRLADVAAFMRTLTDSVPVRLAHVGTDLRFSFVNAAHERRFGLPREAIVGRTRAELMPGVAQNGPADHVAGVLAGEPQHFEYDEQLHGGPIRRIESRLIPDSGPDGAVRGFFAIGNDITERSAAERALRVQSAVFESTSDFIVQTDWRGRIVYLNPAARAFVGMARDEPVGERNFAAYNTADTNRRLAEEALPAMKAHGVWLGQNTVVGAGGRELTVSYLGIAHRDSSGRIGHYSAVMRDITAEVHAQRELLRQTATLRAVVEALPAIVAVVGADRRYRMVNSTLERFVRRPRADIVGRTLLEVLGADDAEIGRPWVERVLAGESVSFDRYNPQHGSHLAMNYVPLRLDDGTVDGFVVIGQDISRHQQEKAHLLKLAQRDALTGLLNRSGFENLLRQRWADNRTRTQLALLYIDLDRFKPVNDNHGHSVGDELLRLFGQRLAGLVRPSDAVARLGGDEFGVLLVHVRESAHAEAVADKVLAAAAAPFALAPGRLHIGASVGLAFSSENGIDDWTALVAAADARLYTAKRAGRGRRAGL